jgi:hypothetical protein
VPAQLTPSVMTEIRVGFRLGQGRVKSQTALR